MAGQPFWTAAGSPQGRAPRMVRVNPDRDAHPTARQGSFLLSGSQWSVRTLVGSTKWQDSHFGLPHAARRASTKDGRVTNRQDRRLGRRHAARKGEHQGWCESHPDRED